jgi:hypothetical protein
VADRYPRLAVSVGPSGRIAKSRKVVVGWCCRPTAAGGAYQIAEACAYCAEIDLAFEWLERAYTQRDPGTGMVRADPLLRSLSGDPRWQLFLEKMGLSD